MKQFFTLTSTILFITGCGNNSGTETETGIETEKIPTVSITGAMRNVMHNGELSGTIALDTISDKTHLYGLGPVEYLKGEILIADGKSYVSKVINDSTMRIEETYNVKAPFFVYSNVTQWYEKSVPDSVETIKQLELYLDAASIKMQRPFAFRITGTVDTAYIHIVNLPDDTEVHSPEEAHQEQKIYPVCNKEVEIIGFFSTEHAGIFIHHDSYVHMHLITADKKQMGHIDSLDLRKGNFKLFLPEKM